MALSSYVVHSVKMMLSDTLVRSYGLVQSQWQANSAIMVLLGAASSLYVIGAVDVIGSLVLHGAVRKSGSLTRTGTIY